MILVLQTTTFGAHGGIPTYNRVVCRALSEIVESTEKCVIVATDRPEDLGADHDLLKKLRLRSFSGRRVAFVSHVVWLALSRRIDLLLIGHVNYAPLGLLLKCFQPSLRYGVMVHGIDVWSPLGWLKRQALKKADFITSVSEYTKQRAVAINDAHSERVYLLPNALEWEDDDKTAQGANPSVPSFSGTRLLTVCRFSRAERYKGVDTVIEALPSILEAVPDVNYYVVGSGEDLERHTQLAKSFGVADRVHFLGAVPTATLRACYNACDIFVMPSAGEGFGIVFLEAMRYAKPVVAAASGAVSEVVDDGLTGKLVPYGEHEQLAGAVIDLCLSSAERERMGKAGYRRFQNNFTFQHFKRKLSAIVLQELPQKASVSVSAHSPESAP